MRQSIQSCAQPIVALIPSEIHEAHHISRINLVQFKRLPVETLLNPPEILFDRERTRIMMIYDTSNVNLFVLHLPSVANQDGPRSQQPVFYCISLGLLILKSYLLIYCLGISTLRLTNP